MRRVHPDGHVEDRPLPWARFPWGRCRARLDAGDVGHPDPYFGRCELARHDAAVVDHALDRGTVVIRWSASIRWEGP